MTLKHFGALNARDSMPSTMNRTIACAVDKDIHGQIIAGKPLSARAKADLSVVNSLRSAYRNVSIIGISERCHLSIKSLLEVEADVIFNLAFSGLPFEAPFAGYLELLRVPFTGSGQVGIGLSRDKLRSRHLLRAAGLKVPEFVEIVKGVAPTISFTPPFIVKPRSLTGSTGIYAGSVVAIKSKVRECANRIWDRFDDSALCEAFIVGRELRVGIIETQQGIDIAGITEWIYGAAKPGWGFKFEALKSNRRVRQAHRVTKTYARLSPSLVRSVHGIAQAAMSILGIRGYAALDLRIDENQQVFVLEVNANPGLSSTATTWIRPSFDHNIQRIVNAAFLTRRV